MANWSKNKVNPSDINNGNEYTVNDDVSLEQLNSMVNSGLYSQDFAEHLTDTPDTSDAGTVGTPSVTFVDNVQDGITYKKFKFSNLKGATGAAIVSTTLQGQDANGGNIYQQTFDNGATATFTAPRGPAVTVDSAISSTSTNPLQNKAVYNSTSAISINGTSATGSNRTASIYAPTSPGQGAQILKSKANSAPVWGSLESNIVNILWFGLNSITTGQKTLLNSLHFSYFPFICFDMLSNVDEHTAIMIPTDMLTNNTASNAPLLLNARSSNDRQVVIYKVDDTHFYLKSISNIKQFYIYGVGLY